MCWQVGEIPIGCCHTVYTACNTVTDSFNRADAGDGTLGSADTGQRWSNVDPAVMVFNAGYWTTQGTTPNTAQAQVPTLDRYRVMRTLIDTGGNNQDITVTGESDHDDSLRLFARASADGKFYYETVFTHYTDTHVYKQVPGSRVILATIPNITLNTPFTARMRVKDNALDVWLNGTNIASVTINPDEADGFCETYWTFAGLGQDHGGPGGSAPSQLTVYTDTHWDDFSVVAP